MAVLARAALMAVTGAVAAIGVVAVAVVAAITAAITTLITAATAMRAALMPAFIRLIRPMGGPLAGAPVGRRDRHADQPFDIAQERRSSESQNEIATPSAPARAVRPMRWT